MSKIKSMGKFTGFGMRTKVVDPRTLVISTCGKNDTSSRGDQHSWAWSNPTNRAVIHEYEGVEAVSTEGMWQGTKIFKEGGRPDPLTLAGDWRRGKAKRPIGAWAGEGSPLITTPGEARRRIYLPCYLRQIRYWIQDPEVQRWIEAARNHSGPVYLRDHDVGRGVDRKGAMSHAWVLAVFLNTGELP